MAVWNKRAWTADEDAAIVAGYRSGTQGVNKVLAYQLGCTPRSISARAAKLGVPPLIATQQRGGMLRWSPEEIAVIRQHLGEPIAQLRARLYRKGHSRSLVSIRTVITRKRAEGEWPRREELLDERDWLDVPSIAVGMGVGEHLVDYWLAKRGLRYTTISSRRRAVSWTHLCAWLKDNAGLWDHRKADHFFLIDVLTYKKGKT